MAIETSDLLRALRHKVNADESPQRSHIWFKIRVGGDVVRTVSVSHGAAKQIGQPLLGRMAKELGVSSRQLEELVSCTLDAPTFYQIASGISEGSTSRSHQS